MRRFKPYKRSLKSSQYSRRKGFFSRGKKTHAFSRTSYANPRFRYDNDFEKNDFQTLLSRFHYKNSFPPETNAAAIKHAKLAHTQLNNTSKSSWNNNGRLDKTHLPVITIDGNDAKDHDDAICLQKTPNGFQLDVHIADVSHYVPKDSPIELEAKKRSTSVYLLNKVLPMLPECLSNDLCSLVEGKNRFALSCMMQINPQGKMTSYEFAPTVIRNRKRLTYQKVNPVLQGKPSPLPTELKQQLHLMGELQKLLHQKRTQEGSIHFQTESIHVLLTGESVTHIAPQPLLDSEGLIEEFMLVANQCAAKFMEQNKQGIYRVHEAPDKIKLQAFHTLAHARGYPLPNDPNPLSSFPPKKTNIKPSSNPFPHPSTISSSPKRSSPA